MEKPPSGIQNAVNKNKRQRRSMKMAYIEIEDTEDRGDESWVCHPKLQRKVEFNWAIQ